MTDYYDDLETRDPEQREKALLALLPAHIANAKDKAPYFGSMLKDIEPRQVSDRSALATITVTRKSDLMSLQKQDAPFGTVVSHRTKSATYTNILSAMV